MTWARAGDVGGGAREGKRCLVKEVVKSGGGLSKIEICNLAAGAQAGVFRHLTYKLDKLLGYYQNSPAREPFGAILTGGGVMANKVLRVQLRKLGRKYNLEVFFPEQKKLCGDNGAMIGIAGWRRLGAGAEDESLELERAPQLNLGD